ncbi:MAG: hypothetical protein ACJAWL_003574 [Motiliproteus sp.]|jgi:hypothetical protein
MAPRPSMFSRRQLNLLIIVTATVIALLSIPAEPWPQIQRSALPLMPLSYISDDDLPPELRLSFALPRPSLLPPAPQRILLQLLEQRLASSGSAYSIRLHRDRITATIKAASASALRLPLQQLPALLTQPFARDAINHAINLERAQQHLRRNQPSPLLQADAWLPQQHPDSNPDEVSLELINLLQQRLFSRSPSSLSLTGLPPEPLIATLNSALQQFGSVFEGSAPAGSVLGGSESPDPELTGARDLRASSTRSAAAPADLGPVAALQPLPGRASPRFPQALLLSRMLETLVPEARIRFYPGSETSWLIWLTPQASEPWLTDQIRQLKLRLAAMKDWEFERAADDLRAQLERRMQDPAAIAEQLEVIAFYQLPVDYLPQFEATIASLTRTQIRQQLLDLLQPGRFSYPANPAFNNALSKP